MYVDLTLYFDEDIKLEIIIEKLEQAGLKYSSIKRSNNKTTLPNYEEGKIHEGCNDCGDKEEEIQ